jgi:guanosine-3',5'-bis(diphosphate) 3'-pyrophosphohydrolase
MISAGILFSEEVFVFTPKGELKTLPHGATALDFAFDIHTQVGSKCIGAKVNNKLVPINYVMKNGDQIEILTSSKAKAARRLAAICCHLKGKRQN